MKKNKKPARSNSATRLFLSRVCYIDRQIASGRYPTTKELAEGWGSASISTISRDIELMRNDLNAPIEYSPEHRGYYYTKKNYRIPMSFTGADELLALGMARNIMSVYKNTPIYSAAENLLNDITAPLVEENNASWYENRIVIPQVPQVIIPKLTWDVIIKAMRENKVLGLDYKGNNDDDYESRRVRPYQLLFDNGIWYLYGYSEERKEIRMFSLSRMKNPVVLQKTFSLPKDFDYREKVEGSYFGVFKGIKIEKYKIAFYDYAVSFVKERKWVEGQKITEQKDGSIIISFKSSQFQKVLEWVLARGSVARPLEPASLVKEWKRNVDEMRKMMRRR